MGFLSLQFFLFQILLLVLYFALRKEGKDDLAKLSLVLASMIFFAGYGASSFLIFFALSLINLIYSRKVLKPGNKALLALGIVIVVLPLLVFKYLDFFAINITGLFGYEFSGFNILQPLAISYYTFMMITWIVDTYRGETDGISAPDYLVYIWFFPKAVMGPITRADELIPQLNDKKRFLPDPENIATGFVWFTIGMSKKLLLSSRFGAASAYGFMLGDQMNFAEGWLCSIAYTFEIYLDFSGYCDMAAGISKMFNIDLPMNFNSPYKADSIGDFWKRWHISLTSFLRKYIYFPLGGNRKGKVRTYFNILAIFVISGFWHGANWTFILWGLLHGVAQIVERLIGNGIKKIPKPVRVAVTFILVNIGWVLFAAPNMDMAATFLSRMFRFEALMPAAGFYDAFDMGTVPFIRYHLNIAIPLLYVATFICLQCTKNIYDKKIKPSFRLALVTGILFAWSFLYANSVSGFIYFQF